MGREAGHVEWNIQIKDNPTQVRDLLNHPVLSQRTENGTIQSIHSSSFAKKDGKGANFIPFFSLSLSMESGRVQMSVAQVWPKNWLR